MKGCVCLVGFASCKALVHTRPASVPGLNVGLPPSPRLGLRPKPHFKIVSFLIACKIRTLFLLFVIRVFAVGIFVLDEDFLYIFKLVLFLFLFHIRGVREVDRLVCFVIYTVDVTVHV